jgi:MFS family permease
MTETPLRARLGALFLVVFINLVGFGVVLPVFPFIGTLVGATPGETTLAMACYSLGQFAGAPLWGRMSDKIGRRPVLVWSLVGSLISYIIMANASDILTLGFARLFGGLMAGNIAAAFAYAGDVTTPAERPKAMGLIGAAFGLGFIFGPAIGGIVAGDSPDLGDFANVCYVAAAITILAGLAVWRLLPESLTPERRARAESATTPVKPGEVLAAKPVLWALMTLTLLVIGSAALMESTFAFFAHDRFGWGPRDVGLSFGMIGVIAAGLQATAAAPLGNRFGAGAVAVFGIAVYTAGLGAMAFVSTSVALITTLALTAVGVGLFNPAFQTLVAAESNDGDRGLVNGLTQGASSLGRVVGPGVSGTIYAGVGMTAPFIGGAATMLIALAVAFGVWKRSRA